MAPVPHAAVHEVSEEARLRRAEQDKSEGVALFQSGQYFKSYQAWEMVQSDFFRKAFLGKSSFQREKDEKQPTLMKNRGR